MIITFSNIERCKYVPEFKSTFSELETYEYDYIAILFETLSLLIIEMYEMRLIEINSNSQRSSTRKKERERGNNLNDEFSFECSVENIV